MTAGQEPQRGPVLYPDPAGLAVAELFATLDASMWADLADHLTDREAEAIGTALEAAAADGDVIDVVLD